MTTMESRKRHKKTEKDALSCGCSHIFKATPEKGVWMVTAYPTNNRGGPRKVEVTTTVFKCANCRETKEYPDFWETNFETPKLPIAAKKRTPKKAPPKLKAENA